MRKTFLIVVGSVAVPLAFQTVGQLAIMVFITFEGIEGSGKTTQLKLLAEVLSRNGISVESTREPGGTPLGDAIRKIFLDPANSGMSAREELSLIEKARSEHVSKVIRPALEAGKVVLCDRFTDSTLAYQGYARGLDLEMIQDSIRRATKGLQLDATLLLNLDVSVGLERADGSSKTGPQETRFEMEPREFHERVQDGFLLLAKKETDRIKVVDASGDPRSVHLRVLETLKASKVSSVLDRVQGVKCH
jgi:dTMP kinase